VKNIQKHIAWLFLVLFSITFLPVNFLHHHAEDEHAMAMHNHSNAEKHHCELDDYVCDISNQTQHCEHPQHIAKTVAKCFSCEFHFVKHYQNNSFNYIAEIPVLLTQHKPFTSANLRKANILLSNKGPPQLYIHIS
jgi:hypothetical protein